MSKKAEKVGSITLAQAYSGFLGIAKLSEEIGNTVSASVAFKIARLQKALQPEAQLFEEKRLEVMKKYGKEVKPEVGAPYYTTDGQPEEEQEKAKNELLELAKTMVEIAVEKPMIPPECPVKPALLMPVLDLVDVAD